MAEDLMDKLFSFFAGSGLSDEKQNMLKHIGKELANNKYAKFFRIRSEEADPSFMSFLFSTYKVIYPIRQFMKDEKKMAHLMELIVESCLDTNIREIVNRLDHQTLDEKAKTMPGEELIAHIQADTEMLVSRFDNKKVNDINRRYEITAALKRFVNYNFPGFFKKFDPHFADGSFAYEPKFPAMKTILIIDQIGNFLSVTQSLRPEDDWNALLNLIKTCEEGQDLVIAEQFTAMIKQLREIHTSKILELMVQYTLRNPVWQYKHITFQETVGEEWLEMKRAESNKYIKKINTIKKNSQISILLKQIFETTDLVRLDNYTVQLGEVYTRKNLDTFYYAEGINYLKAFLEDYADRELRELSDILLIRGQWTNNAMSREMSEAVHKLLETVKNIADLDVLLSEDGADGSRLRAAVMRVDRDTTQIRYINAILGKINNQALEIINDAAQSLIVIGKHLKNLIEDIQKKHPELILNWRELNLASKEPISQKMTEEYKRVNYFIQLLHLCTLV